jgi:hypothetical protein
LGSRRRKRGGDFRRRMMIFERIVESIGTDVGGRGLRMEGTRRGRENLREIFERSARSGRSNARLYNEERVQEEQAESKSGKKRGKV